MIRGLLLGLVVLVATRAGAVNVAFVNYTNGGQNSRATTSVITRTMVAGNTGLVQVFETCKNGAPGADPTVADTAGVTWTQIATITQTVPWGPGGTVSTMREYVFTTAAGALLASTSTTVTWGAAIPGIAASALYQFSNAASIGGICTNYWQSGTTQQCNLVTCDNSNILVCMGAYWDMGGGMVSTRTGTAQLAQWDLMNNNLWVDEFWVESMYQTLATAGSATVGYTSAKAPPLAEVITVEVRNGSGNTRTQTNTPTPSNTITATPTYTAVATNTLQATNTFIATNTPVNTNTPVSRGVIHDKIVWAVDGWLGVLAVLDRDAAAVVIGTVVARPSETPVPDFTPGALPGSIYAAADGLRFMVLQPGEAVPEGYLLYSQTRSRTRTATPTRTYTPTVTPTRTPTP